MSRWKRFLKLRKQNDAVKIALLLGLAALGFFAGAGYRGVRLYRFVNTPVEYVLTGGDSDGLAKLEELEGVAAVSSQQERMMTVLYQGKEYPISYTILSEDYLKAVFGIQQRGAAQTFYMNRAAYRQFERGEGEMLVSCIPEAASSEPSGTSGASADLKQRTAKMLLTETILEEEQPQIFTAQTIPDTQTQDRQLRVCFRKQELDGGQIKQLESLGFMLADREALLQSECEKKELLLRLKYEAGIAVVCLIAAGALQKFGNRME